MYQMVAKTAQVADSVILMVTDIHQPRLTLHAKPARLENGAANMVQNLKANVSIAKLADIHPHWLQQQRVNVYPAVQANI